jgi:thioredoxin reductase (NADPH)
MTVRELPAEGARDLTGRGVYYGVAAAEVNYYRDNPVIVVGGGNSAGQGALFLSRYASDVTILIRGENLQTSMSHYLIDQIEHAENVRLLTRREVVSVQGNEHLSSVTIRNLDREDEVETLTASAMVVFIGSVPNTSVVQGLLAEDAGGFILTGSDLPKLEGRPRGWSLNRDPYLLETSVPGIFAVGDVRHGSSKRVAAAVGEGSTAVRMVHEYLGTV